MVFDYCVVGGTGAVGAAIVKRLRKNGSVLILNSSNCNLFDVDLQIPSVRVKNFINAAGTYGGLKQYESNVNNFAKNFSENLLKLCIATQPDRVINISSAALSNQKNLINTCVYFNYVSEKKNIEIMLDSSGAKCVSHLRCTNIVSSYENYVKSGHSISSIYRLIKSNSEQVNVWSSELDWREYIDADDVAEYVNFLINGSLCGTKNLGSGKKTYISEIVSYIAKKLAFKGKIFFSQPFKEGPSQGVVGWESNDNDAPINFKPADIYCSLDKCLSSWSKLKAAC